MKFRCDSKIMAGRLKADGGRTASLARSAFTLIEMLVVLVIIGIILGIGLPALKGFGQANKMTAGPRQLMADLNHARQAAISKRTTVFVVFIPGVGSGDFWTTVNTFPPPARQEALRLASGQYSSYAVLTLRNVGDQLGRPTPHYLSEWRTLPDGVFIATNKFIPRPDLGSLPEYGLADGISYVAFPRLLLPFPSIHTNSVMQRAAALPYVAFNPQGRLVEFHGSETVTRSADEVIPLAQGSIFTPRTPEGAPLAPDVLETPPGNSIDNYHVIRMDWATGRASLQRKEIQ